MAAEQSPRALYPAVGGRKLDYCGCDRLDESFGKNIVRIHLIMILTSPATRLYSFMVLDKAGSSVRKGCATTHFLFVKRY